MTVYIANDIIILRGDIMAYKKVCLNCGKNFITTDKRSVNCSRKCKGEYQFKGNIKRIEKEKQIENLKNWLIQKYSKEKQTFRQILRELDVTNRTVRKLLDYYKIPVRHGSNAIKAQWATKEKRDARRKPNIYIEKSNYTEIKIYRKSKDIYETALIDKEDTEKCKKHHWNITDGYLAYSYIANKKESSLRIHRYLINVPEDKIVDHINGDPLDNRKCNLRICTKLENAWNRTTNKDSKTGYKGITLTKWNTYEVSIAYKGNKIYLGAYKIKKDAIEARRKAELKYFGEYSYLNRTNILI